MSGVALEPTNRAARRRAVGGAGRMDTWGRRPHATGTASLYTHVVLVWPGQRARLGRRIARPL